MWRSLVLCLCIVAGGQREERWDWGAVANPRHGQCVRTATSSLKGLLSDGTVCGLFLQGTHAQLHRGKSRFLVAQLLQRASVLSAQRADVHVR